MATSHKCMQSMPWTLMHPHTTIHLWHIKANICFNTLSGCMSGCSGRLCWVKMFFLMYSQALYIFAGLIMLQFCLRARMVHILNSGFHLFTQNVWIFSKCCVLWMLKDQSSLQFLLFFLTYWWLCNRALSHSSLLLGKTLVDVSLIPNPDIRTYHPLICWL